MTTQTKPAAPRFSPRRRKRRSKGTIVFRVIFLTMLAASLAAVLFGLKVLCSFLEDYEQSLPEKAAENVISELRQGNTEALYQSAGFVPNEYEDDSAAREYVSSLLDGELTCSKNVKESSGGGLVYNIKCDGKTVCQLSLRKTGEKTEYGFELYEPGEFSGLSVPTKEITVKAPDSAQLYIRGKRVTQEPVSTEAIPECEHFCGYIDKEVSMAAYRISGFTELPEVSAVFPDNSELKCTRNGNEYSFSLESGDIPQELSELAVNASKTYSKFISADAPFSAVAAFVPEDVPFYENIRDYESNFYTPHSDYDFLDVKVCGSQRYTEGCAAVRVTYTQRIYAGWYGDFDFPTDNTVYLAEHGGEWLVTDIVMN